MRCRERYLRRQFGQIAGAAVVVIFLVAATVALSNSNVVAQRSPTPAPAAAQFEPKAVLTRYCVTCHNERLKTAGLTLDTVDVTKPFEHAEVFERVITKLRAGAMPPPGSARPDAATYDAMVRWLESEIDRAAAVRPNPGRIGAVQRLNRAGYRNAVRDLLALDVDVSADLPGDETADGSFDNFADVLSISTAHLERYLSVSRQITRLAVGLPPVTPGLERFSIPSRVLQEDQESEALPFGSRGGIAVSYVFPTDGEYLLKLRLRRNYADYIQGMGWPQPLDVRIDGKLVKRLSVGGEAPGRGQAVSYAGDGQPGFAGDERWEAYMLGGADAKLEVRVPVPAGPHTVGVSFPRMFFESEGLVHPETKGSVLAYDERYFGHAALDAVEIGGPYSATAVAKNTPSRRAIFICEPKTVAEEEPCASRILARLARLAYRRPTTPADIDALMGFFRTGRRQGGTFDHGVQLALEETLVDPEFLLRIYRERPGGGSDQPYRLSDLEVASRLSFFLWNSIPDDRLLTLAEQGKLTTPSVLEQETRRMLADPRAAATLVDDFAAQWLNLRRIAEVVIDSARYPNYDLTLMRAFQTETELFVASTLREDRSVSDLLKADYTFVNERLAKHYGIPGIYGSRFRRVTLPNLNQRGGLLGQGALLATTSYPDRTSPVLRGKWLLDNIFGMPVPNPPANVNTQLPEPARGARPPSIRERLSQHRNNAMCATCHSVIDPIGFSLENFDVIGEWRTTDESRQPVDASGTTTSGQKIEGLAGLRTVLLRDPKQFPRTVTEKLMAFALGRRLEYYDRSTVRKIVDDAAAQNYRWSSIVMGIVKSPAFLMRSTSAATLAAN